MFPELVNLLERATMIETAVRQCGSDLVEPAHRVKVDGTRLDAQHVRLLIGNRSHGDVYVGWRDGYLDGVQPQCLRELADSRFEFVRGIAAGLVCRAGKA